MTINPFNMTTAVNTTEIYIPEKIPIYLRLHGNPIRTVVYCTKPGNYIVDYYMDYDHNGYYMKQYSTVHTHDGYEFDGWHVWKEHLHP